ncbi:uncharacterized protein LOC127761818 isoform X2 [Oryza glaberrima]|uniref:uncharacterized protein LOC127761818 isoform X2 n=1 Tax=Oryza glaberrima TaxID=4538 RepID=UPI00224C3CA3|nr:uncharacterized protein LOC127761818 isoform X2 [Oryza glaberrima]
MGLICPRAELLDRAVHPGQHVSADAKTVEHIYLVLIFVCIHGVRFISIFALHLHGIRMRSIERRKMVVDHGAASRNIQECSGAYVGLNLKSLNFGHSLLLNHCNLYLVT